MFVFTASEAEWLPASWTSQAVAADDAGRVGARGGSACGGHAGGRARGQQDVAGATPRGEMIDGIQVMRLIDVLMTNF